VYHGDLDTPKTTKSAREGALGPETIADLQQWAKLRLDPSPDAFVFPSENLKSPIRCDNLWHRWIGPKAQTDRHGVGELSGDAASERQLRTIKAERIRKHPPTSGVLILVLAWMYTQAQIWLRDCR
jgi:hypothetical protein